ncbi:MAG: DEAD/DEAH box helicase family protein, partial [Verrucomicrobia bacterium]|nr:DEAD/DEAH box helicase family protein [Verrucomicrobiota bacterium]
NPEFYRAQAMRLPVRNIPRIIACSEEHPNHISLPRGCLEDLLKLLSELKIKHKIKDERHCGVPLTAIFQGELRVEQKAAAVAILSDDIGVLSATTAFGKTVVASWLIAKRKVSTLILVHRRQLQDQWVARLKSFLDLPSNAIGKIGGGRKKPTGLVDVALIQSLVKKGEVDDLVSQYGHIIVDECHHLSAFSFEQVARKANARFVTGLSATVARKDGHHPIIWMQCGPVRYRVNAKEQAALRPFTHRVFVRPTAFVPLRAAPLDLRLQFNELYDELIKDTRRNSLICEEIIQAVHQGRFPVVLTERNEHLDNLANELSPHIPNLIMLRGGMRAKELTGAMNRLTSLPETESRVLLATGKFIGEGFDDARLDTLFLTLPISWRGTIAQYVGRLHRLHSLKQEVQVYDYADLNVPMLARMFNRRCKGYESLGYQILLPASAIPGWPAEVPLPSDPAWKADYAASVRRLVLDGVDGYLASLFVNVATKFSPDDEGERRARSATEAFLFRRLETLAQTKGLFRLNVELSIPFDGWGRMEVDLLSANTRIAIELDGPQHLGSADAYRRDRRKDMLLQQNGYTVLRFLTEDVGKSLDDVLDIILRSLAHHDQRRASQ